MINLEQYQKYILRPVLAHLELESVAAEKLLMGTLVEESSGHYFHQVGGGPALGFFQIEPATHDDLWENYLKYKPDLNMKLHELLAPTPDRHSQILCNCFYSCAVARLLYYRQPAALPDADDLPAMAAYYKKYFNTPLGAATELQWLQNYEKHVAPLF